MQIRLKNPFGHVEALSGSSTTASPSRRMATSRPEKRYSFGRRTACDLPFINSFAVIMVYIIYDIAGLSIVTCDPSITCQTQPGS